MSKNQNHGKMKRWRAEAFKSNAVATREALKNGDIRPGQRVTHTGRREKPNFQYTRAWMSPLLTKLFTRVGLINKEAPQV
jgi:hypothetical protein